MNCEWLLDGEHETGAAAPSVNPKSDKVLTNPMIVNLVFLVYNPLLMITLYFEFSCMYVPDSLQRKKGRVAPRIPAYLHSIQSCATATSMPL